METSTHTLNERLKRLEPTTKICSYCVDGKMDKINDSYFVPVFKEADRTNVIVYRSVKYKKIEVGVPRCANCKSIHESAKTKAAIISIIMCVSIFAFAIYNFINFHVFITVLLIFGSFALGFGGYLYLQNNFSRKQGIYPLKEGAENDPMVQSLLNSGWTLTMPNA